MGKRILTEIANHTSDKLAVAFVPPVLFSSGIEISVAFSMKHLFLTTSLTTL